MKMGTNKFEEEYIEYLEKINANLRNQSLRVKEFENRLLNKEIRNRHLEIVMDDVKNICNSTCEAIDKFFENFTATMNSMKNVLMWKSQVLLIPQKLASALNPDMNEVSHTSGSSNSDSGFSSVNDNSQSKNGRKCGTAKVSPMIKGHVISAPRIHLNRLTDDLGPQARRPIAGALSPIIEQSPNTSPHDMPSPVFRNIQIPLRRLKIDNFTGKPAVSEVPFDAKNSPKINFTGRNCAGFELRRRYSSLGENERFRMMRDRRAEVVNGSKHGDEVTEDGDCMNEEHPGSRSEALENDVHGKSRRNISDDVDPLEGPSWLFNKQQIPEESEHPGLSSLQYRFVNFKRMNYARSNRVLSDENQKRDVLNFNDDAQMGNFELNPNQELMRENSFPPEKEETSETNSSNSSEESLSGHSSSLFETERPEGYNKFDDSDLGRSKVNLSFSYSPADRKSLERKSIHEREESLQVIEPNIVANTSNGSVRLSNGRNYRSRGNKSLTNVSMDCYVNLSKLKLESDKRETPKRWKVDEVEPVVVLGKSNRRSTKRYGSSGTTPEAGVSNESRLNSVRPRTKRRAAERCIEDKVWVDVTPKWETKIKREKGGRKYGKQTVSVPKKSKKQTKKSSK